MTGRGEATVGTSVGCQGNRLRDLGQEMYFEHEEVQFSEEEVKGQSHNPLHYLVTSPGHPVAPLSMHLKRSRTKFLSEWS